MINWKDVLNLRVFKSILIKKGAVIRVENSDGTVSSVDLAELAALDGLAAADLAKIDGITNGTAAAGKALVADSNIDVSGMRHVGLTGTATVGAIAGADAALDVTGIAAAQGGAITITGGTSSTAGNVGGVVAIVGGTSGTTSAGAAVSLTGAVSGTTGALNGGAATVTGGAGHSTSTGRGGTASLVGGASGGGATGAGGVAKVTGGAAVSTNADGGAAIIAGGAKNGSGFIGPVVLGNAQLMPIWYPQAAPAADGADTPFTATVAQLIAGLISMTPTTGRAITTPTGAEMDAGVAFADVPATFGFDFSIQNRAAFAATDDIITLTAGASGVTVTGSATVAPGVTARFRAVRTTTATWIFYKIAG